jgi:hypothetical protein
MALQARSEATRQKILDATIDLFSQVGYAAAELGEIIDRAGMTRARFVPPLRLQRRAGNRDHRTRHQPDPRRVPPRVRI